MDLALVIPAHNDTQPLHRLLSRIGELGCVGQIIICDDGSDPAISAPPLAELARLDQEKVILLRHASPRGAGAARNLALPHIMTEHALFIDADDLPTRELPQLLLDLEEKEFDFCIFQHHDSRQQKQGEWGQMPFDQALWRAAGVSIGALSPVSPKAARHLCRTANYPWNKIYRTAFLRDNGIRCTEISVHNDVELHWLSFLKADKILASDRICVIHHVNSAHHRLTNRTGPERLDVFIALTRIAEYINAAEDSLYALSFYQFSIGLIDWIAGLIQPHLKEQLTERARYFFDVYIPPVIQSFLTEQERDRLQRVLQRPVPPSTAAR